MEKNNLNSQARDLYVPGQATDGAVYQIDTLYRPSVWILFYLIHI